MRRTLTLAAILGFATTLPAQKADNPFNQRLSGDQAILHAIDRLSFGPRPGDIEAVKKMGLKQWIDLQLHPERIPADEVLETLANSFVEPDAGGSYRPLRQDPGAIASAAGGAAAGSKDDCAQQRSCDP